jgi:hypothetical protein
VVGFGVHPGSPFLDVAEASAVRPVSDPDTIRSSGERLEPYLELALSRAGANRPEIERALLDAPKSQRDGIAFLVRYMPEQDLRSLPAERILEEADLAYRAWNEAPWGPRISRELFLNDVLPYSVVSEVRASWRRFLRARAVPLVAGARTPGEAAVRLNQEIYRRFGVRYSPERSRTDQNAMQVIAEQKATCTGLSVLLVSACRSVGVPARLVGVPLWADSSGNHSWVEVWDDGWHFTGAAEPTEDRLDDGWFVDAASRAIPGVPGHSIYATSWVDTGIQFPLVWDEDGSLDYVHAVDVTERYAGSAPTPEGRARVEFVVRDRTGRRVPTRLTVRDVSTGRARKDLPGGDVVSRLGNEHSDPGMLRGSVAVFEGTTKSDSADGNDHLAVLLHESREYSVEFTTERGPKVLRLDPRDDALVAICWETGEPLSTSGHLSDGNLGTESASGAPPDHAVPRWGRRNR